MLGNHKTIIYLKRETIKIVKVSISLVKKISMEAELPWNEKNIEAILKDISKTFKTKNIRILIDPDICYSLVIDWENENLPTRNDIQVLAAEKIPEHLDNDWWDYKLLVTNEGKKILFFAPVKEVYKKIISAIKETELNHEGSYPLEFLPKTKNDFLTFSEINLDGKDKDTLALKPKTKNEKKNVEKAIISKKDEEKSKLPMLIGILVILILTLVGVIVLKNNNQELKTPIPKENVNITVTPIPTKEKINFEDYSLLILNSTNTAGLAGEVEEILLAEGFSTIETGNATEEVKLSNISIKTDTPKEILDNIIRALNSDFNFQDKNLELEEKSQYDVIVTLGKRKEPAQ
jgi:hypothetical protein